MNSAEVTYKAAYITHESIVAVQQWCRENAPDVKPDTTWLGRVILVAEQEGRKTKGWKSYSPDDFLRQFRWVSTDTIGFTPVMKHNQ